MLATSIERVTIKWWLRLYYWSINTTYHRKQTRSNLRRDFSATSSRVYNTSVAALDGESCSSYNQSARKWSCRYMCIYISGHEEFLLTMKLRLYYSVACISFLDNILTYFYTFNYTLLALYPKPKTHTPAHDSLHCDVQAIRRRKRKKQRDKDHLVVINSLMGVFQAAIPPH